MFLGNFVRQKIEYVWNLNKTNIAMVFAFARGGFETFNKCVRRLSLERNNRKTQVLEKNFSVNFEKVKNNKGQVSMSVEKRLRLNFANISLFLKTG